MHTHTLLPGTRCLPNTSMGGPAGALPFAPSACKPFTRSTTMSGPVCDRRATVPGGAPRTFSSTARHARKIPARQCRILLLLLTLSCAGSGAQAATAKNSWRARLAAKNIPACANKARASGRGWGRRASTTSPSAPPSRLLLLSRVNIPRRIAIQVWFDSMSSTTALVACPRSDRTAYASFLKLR